MEKLTYDEYFSALQTTDEGKEAITDYERALATQRFKSRFGLNGNISPEAKIKLQNMTPREFESLRTYQIGQLYSAYYDREIRSTHLKLLDVRDVDDTNIDSVRRVTGDRAYQVYNNGILALSEDDIQIISSIVKTQSHQRSDDPMYRLKSLSSYKLCNCIDEMEAIIEIAKNSLNIERGALGVGKVCRETNALKRTMGKQEKRNIFYIEDYESCAKLERTSKISLLMNKLKTSVEKFLNPDKEKFDPNRLGNQEIEEERRE